MADREVVESTVYPEYAGDGVDVTPIRWMLSLTPAERLQFPQDRINDLRTIRELYAGR